MKTINDLFEKIEEVHSLDKEVTDIYSKLKEGSRDRKITISREDKEIEVTEHDLWEEVRHRAKTNALDVLKEKYPTEMDLLMKHQNLIDEVNVYLIQNYGVNPTEMRMTKLLVLIKDIIKNENS